MTGAVVRGDAVRLPLRDASVDLIITSPPYFALRSYRDGGEHYGGQVGDEPTATAFLQSLWACTAEWQRVLKPTGSIWVNLGDKYATSGSRQGISNHGMGASTLAGKTSPDAERRRQFRETLRAERERRPMIPGPTSTIISRSKVMAEIQLATRPYAQTSEVRAKSLMGLPWRYAVGCTDGLAGPPLVLRAEVVWWKRNGMPETVTDRVRRAHEQWFHLTREGHYYSAIDEVREMGTVLSVARVPGSVWDVPTDGLVVPEAVRDFYHLPDHFAAFPQELPRRIVLGWSPGGICTDCGEGRRPVVEVSEAYREWRQKVGDWNRDKRADGGGYDLTMGNGTGAIGGAVPAQEAQIVGYSCACPAPYAATRPAVVLDPFSGTGTVAGVANALGRLGVGVDLSYDYCRLAQWFLRDGRRFAKTASRTDGERQRSLFEGWYGDTDPDPFDGD